jgi:hypothetical protein
VAALALAPVGLIRPFHQTSVEREKGASYGACL